MSKQTNIDALRRAVNLAGGQTALGKAVGRDQSTVWNWLNDPKQELPTSIAKEIETALAGQVTRLELRPDVFG